MAAPKRTPFQIEHDRREIARLYLQRQPQHVIAQALGLTRSLVSYDLAEIQKQWRAAAIVDLDERRAEELARLDALEREYWRAWEASHDPWEDPAAPEAYEGELALKRAQKAAAGKKVQRTGFSGYLEGVERCIEQRCRILGLSAEGKGSAAAGTPQTIIIFENVVPGLDARDAEPINVTPRSSVLAGLLGDAPDDEGGGDGSGTAGAADLQPGAESEAG